MSQQGTEHAPYLVFVLVRPNILIRVLCLPYPIEVLPDTGELCNRKGMVEAFIHALKQGIVFGFKQCLSREARALKPGCGVRPGNRDEHKGDQHNG
ncbi:hypothetical protein Q666_10440 [Marinobacter sp. ES-1]|nr:hypothetical protein Q666_10440 [Marinobacter sp. ES-1]